MQKHYGLFCNLYYTVLVSILFVLLIQRAVNVGITHDESLTYTIVSNDGSGHNAYKDTANNHLLNTWLIKQSIRLCGNDNLLTLRLPNLIAFLVYALSVWLILKEWKNSVFAFVAASSLLLLNPYLFEFFALARGYGLAISLGTLALSFFLRVRKTHDLRRFSIDFFFAMLFSTLASYANYIMLNLNIALLILFGLEYLLIHYQTFSRQSWRPLLAIFLILLLSFKHLIQIHDNLILLQNNNELYFGGHDSFVFSTLRILVQRSIYFSYYGEAFWVNLLNVLLVMFFALGVIMVYNKIYSVLKKSYLVLSLLVAASVLQYYMFNIPWPIERTSLIYIPLISLTFFLSTDGVLGLLKGLSNISRVVASSFGSVIYLLIVLIFTYHFYSNINKSYSIEWKFDAHTHYVSKQIMSDYSQKNVIVYTSWMLKPSMEYYFRKSTRYNKVCSDVSCFELCNLAYCFESDRLVGDSNFRVVKKFDDTGTVLLERIGLQETIE